MKVWFITGASRGFGALITQEALAAGDAVVATARDPKSVDRQDRQPPQFVGREARRHQGRRSARCGEGRVKRFSVVSTSSSTMPATGCWAQSRNRARTEVERMFQTNGFGVLNVIRAVLPEMRRQRAWAMSSTSPPSVVTPDMSAGAPMARRSSPSKASTIAGTGGGTARYQGDGGRARLLPHRLPG